MKAVVAPFLFLTLTTPLGAEPPARTELSDEETKVSYWRRIIQARLDLVRLDKPDADPVADLRRVLTDATTSRHRLAHIDAGPVDDIPPLPDLAEIWARQVDPSDSGSVARLDSDLDAAERELSAYRRELHSKRAADAHEPDPDGADRRRPEAGIWWQGLEGSQSRVAEADA